MSDCVRPVVRSIDPQLPLTNVESMDRVVTEGHAPRRFNTALMSAFAGAALPLALLGIYSVTAFSTATRAQATAIRRALGSQRSSVMRLIIISAAKLGLLGCSIGVAIAFFATRLLRSFLFQVDSLDVGCAAFDAAKVTSRILQISDVDLFPLLTPATSANNSRMRLAAR
jgi:ABC-type lipoprotein release transport system permease subunit